METCIDPKVIEILKQLDAMKDSVIVVGRGAVDSNREAHTIIRMLQVENEFLMNKNRVLHDDKKRDNKVVWVSTVSMIVGWVAAAICFAGWMLS